MTATPLAAPVFHDDDPVAALTVSLTVAENATTDQHALTVPVIHVAQELGAALSRGAEHT